MNDAFHEHGRALLPRRPIFRWWCASPMNPTVFITPMHGFKIADTDQSAGFSLVEVMIAILILGVALVGLTQGITTALGSSKESELQTTAALIAAGQIETLRAEGDLDDIEKTGDCGAALPIYRWRETIVGTGVPGLHEVTVVVERAVTGQEIYELKTLLFERPEEASASPSDRRKPNQKRGGRS